MQGVRLGFLFRFIFLTFLFSRTGLLSTIFHELSSYWFVFRFDDVDNGDLMKNVCSFVLDIYNELVLEHFLIIYLPVLFATAVGLFFLVCLDNISVPICGEN